MVYQAIWHAVPGELFFDTDMTNGTARMHGRVVADNNANHVLEIDINLINKRDWATWSILPAVPPAVGLRTYKDATGFATTNNLYPIGIFMK